MGILLGTENSQDFVLFVDWFAKVPPLLLIPPAAVRVSECTLHSGRVLVATVLYRRPIASIDMTFSIIISVKASYLQRIIVFSGF